jgi:hypothetical protein
MQIAVRALEGEVGLVIMFEQPDRPGIRVMALLAVAAECAFMGISVAMTVVAYDAGILECG